MEKSILIAKSVLAKMFNIEIIHFEKHLSRSANINEARRFLIYYLYKECNIKHLHMKKHVPALQNHATSIHHFKKMTDLMSFEKHTKNLYTDFRTIMINHGHSHLMKDYIDAVKDLEVIQNRLSTLKKMI
tara:strand:- start:212 stop:601 length:390 start_codon:yes stop_codon:yes gene_type:complete